MLNAFTNRGERAENAKEVIKEKFGKGKQNVSAVGLQHFKLDRNCFD